jgi:autonomous glycyl radical cofactor GrcA
MANYITKLQADNRDLQAKLDAMQQEIGEVRAYLASAKFWNDPTVQVRDIEARLMNVWRVGIETVAGE